MSRWHTTEWDLLPEKAFQPRGWKSGMTFEGGGKGSSAPPPDPRMGEAALKQIALNERQYDDYRAQDMPWIKDVANQALGISRANADRAGALSDYQLSAMKRNDDRYWNVAVPLEDQLLQDVKRFDSAGYKDQQVASAMGDVQSAGTRSLGQGMRAMARMGVNPNSGKFQAGVAEGQLGQAAALANAANKTRMAADQIGLSTKMQMYGGMKGLAGLGATNAGLATGAMGMGNSSGAAMTGAAGSYTGANNAALAGYNSGVSSGIAGFGNYSNLGIQAANVNAQNDPFNTILGAAAGGAGAYGMKAALSDRRLKTDIKLIGKLSNGLNIYTYRYKAGGPTIMGVMADEVAVIKPQAYIPNAVGDYAAVDYSKL